MKGLIHKEYRKTEKVTHKRERVISRNGSVFWGACKTVDDNDAPHSNK